ncbi:predicted protein, partial [Naegleria gruberi]
MTDRTNKRVHVEGLLKRKMIEETSQSDSQFIKGSKGSSSFAQPSTPKSTRRKIKQDNRSNDMFTIPNQLKSVFYSQENSYQPISLNSKSSKIFNSSLPPTFANFGTIEQSTNNPFQFSNPNNNSIQYSEDDIFRPSAQSTTFTPSKRIDSSNNSSPFFKSANSFDSDYNPTPFSPIKAQGNIHKNSLFSNTQAGSCGSFEFEEQINQQAHQPDTKFNLFRQQQP